jgi:hypothetical protein
MTTTENNAMEEGMRQRVAKNPSALSPTNRTKSTLSATSKMYDVDGDGKLDLAEQAMRDMDTDNRGYLANEKVYKVMMEQMKLQQEVFGLKRMAMVFLAIVFILSLATLGTSFAAAMLAKDTNVENGNLVAKDGGAVVGTSNVAATFTVTEGVPEDGSGRSLQNTFTKADAAIWITRADADKVAAECVGGGSVFLKRSCAGGKTIMDVPFCSLNTLTTTPIGPIYTSTQSSTQSITIDCSSATTGCTGTSQSCPCIVTGDTLACSVSPMNTVENTVNLGTAGNYVILSKAGIDTVASSSIIGDIAVSPIAAAAMTGFGELLTDVNSGNRFSIDTTGQIQGRAYAANYGLPTPGDLTIAVGDMQTAYTDAAGRTRGVGARLNLGAGLLGGAFGGANFPLTPGVYTFDTAVSIKGDIHLQGSATDTFIIQIASNLIQDADYKVILDETWVGIPKAENIFWQVAGYVEVGKKAHMEGIILCKTAVTFITESSLNGRILAQTRVDLQMATITQKP